MIVEAGTLTGDELSAEVAVVGAGPGGIVTALELARAGVDVLLIESGRSPDDAAAQALGEAILDSDGKHAPMDLTTRRGIGGTSAIWGGRCVPFDPVDFEDRPFVDGVWPVSYEELEPLFARTCTWFVCGRPAFDRAAMPHLPASIVPGLQDGDVLSSSFERWSLPTNFGSVYHKELEASANLRVVTGLTCTRVVPSAAGGQIDHLETRREDRALIRVRAKRYVLAAGGLGTTRLLLASPDREGVAIGNHSDHLGRWYMAHVEGVVADVQFTTQPDDTIHGYERDIDGVWVRRRFSFSPDTMRRLGMPNVVAWLANPDPPDARHGSGVLSFVYLILASPLGRFMSPPPQRLALTGHDVPGVPYGPVERTSVRSHLRNIARQPLQTARFAVAFGFGRFLVRGRKSPGFFVRQPSNRYPLMFHGEHLPARESRVVLDESVDALGMPRLRIQARFTEHDIGGIVTAHEQLDRFLRDQGLGHVEYLSDDVPAHIQRRVGAGFHQAGTTRMADDAGDGVVDRNLAVHGYPDLSVASSSTFVTSSQANSTFMIVAFAVRLADRLRAELA